MSRARDPADPQLADFVTLEAAGVRMLVRRGYEEHAERLGLRGVPQESAGRVAGGRAAHPLVVLPGGRRVVVRRYLRGGLLRHLNRDRYLRGHRAFAELRATERARRAGVRVPEVVAAAEYRAWPGYRAALATLWIPDARELAGWLAGGPAESAAVLREAGRQIARMHAAGIAHPDLNLRNLLVADAADGREVHLIDFDRARAFPGAVPGPRRARDLRRLARSARKLRAPIGPAAWEAFREGYGATWPLSSPLG
jgi:3-deoxy-D-manno-octulosonic acid kinase